MTKPGLQQVLREVDEVSTLPHVALRVVEVANDPDSGAADLKEVLEGDPALSARLLRCVNSSAYAVRGKISNLQQAVAYLGVKQVRNLALTASVSQLFAEECSIGWYRRSALWRHMVSVGLYARLIAKSARFPDFEDVFLAGLMHDIGIILEDQFAHDRFRLVVRRSTESYRPLTENEHEFFAFDHTTLGAEVAQRWRFPKVVETAIRNHHAPLANSQADELPTWFVAIANYICSIKEITSMGSNLVRPVDLKEIGILLTVEDLVRISRDFDNGLASYDALFRI
jgi:putative nucleotidyltransferase with HDIG domain